MTHEPPELPDLTNLRRVTLAFAVVLGLIVGSIAAGVIGAVIGVVVGALAGLAVGRLNAAAYRAGAERRARRD